MLCIVRENRKKCGSEWRAVLAL